MPEHVHLLLSEPQTGNLSKAMQVLKQRVSRALHGKKPESKSEVEFLVVGEEEEATAFWQRRFYDFNVWGEKKLTQKLEYMHRNPVDRGLVNHPKDWPWSSWSFYEGDGKGLLPMDAIKPRAEASQNPHP